MADALFENLETQGEAYTVGIVTLPQKLLYAGYLRDHDRERVFSACTLDRIAAFPEAHALPFSKADLERARLNLFARWRLRAASAGVKPAGLPAWIVKVVWRTLFFATIPSTFTGEIFRVSGADAPRRAIRPLQHSLAAVRLSRAIDRAGSQLNECKNAVAIVAFARKLPIVDVDG
ncbi:hypothetical protein HGG71_13970 [Rhodobacteraceae bacterium R_SAG2]|nr:hypothetical protein [Rhodobacteraceae bacterium R_SAG2]